MNTFVLVNSEGRYAIPQKACLRHSTYSLVHYVSKLDSAYVWSAYDRSSGKRHMAYTAAMNQGCVELEAYEVRKVLLGEK